MMPKTKIGTGHRKSAKERAKERKKKKKTMKMHDRSCTVTDWRVSVSLHRALIQHCNRKVESWLFAFA